jgi:hypothetical protein
MFIERFFNPYVSSHERVLYETKDAIEHCLKHHTWIRHYSFKSDEYLKNVGGKLVWNDGSKVDTRKLPRKGNGWGKYFSGLHNLCSF